MLHAASPSTSLRPLHFWGPGSCCVPGGAWEPPLSEDPVAVPFTARAVTVVVETSLDPARQVQGRGWAVVGGEASRMPREWGRGLGEGTFTAEIELPEAGGAEVAVSAALWNVSKRGLPPALPVVLKIKRDPAPPPPELTLVRAADGFSCARCLTVKVCCRPFGRSADVAALLCCRWIVSHFEVATH